MSDEEKVHIEEETEESHDEKVWTEEMKVASGELLETVKKLLHEAGVRRIVIRNREGHTFIEIPLVFGLAGMALLPVYTAIGLIAALATEHSILVERAEKVA